MQEQKRYTAETIEEVKKVSIPEEVAKKMGIRIVEMVFTTPKKVMLRYDGGFRDEVLENVTSMEVMQAASLTSLTFNYHKETGDSSVSTALENYREVIVLD